MPDAEPPQAPTTPATGTPRRAASQRVLFAALIAVLVGLLGFAIVLQVRQNSNTDNLANLREDDLVGILDDQNARADRLRRQIDELQQTLRRLKDSGNQAVAARQQAAKDLQTLGVLLGTVAAHGPGVRVTVTDPSGALAPEDLLDVVQELRGAGAEAIEFSGVRVSTSTAFTGSKGDVSVDGTKITAPYEVLAIGDPKTLDTALNIPGGVASAIRNSGGDLSVAERTTIDVTALRPLPVPRYASPSK